MANENGQFDTKLPHGFYESYHISVVWSWAQVGFGLGISGIFAYAAFAGALFPAIGVWQLSFLASILGLGCVVLLVFLESNRRADRLPPARRRSRFTALTVGAFIGALVTISFGA